MANAFDKAAAQTSSHILGGLAAGDLDFLRAGPQDTSWKTGIQTPISLTFQNTNRTYSGVDCTVALVYNENIVILGNVETISYSIHRDKMPVRTLGRTYAKDYVRGQRTIAGSIIFVQFDESPLYSVYNFFDKKLENAHRFSSPLVDEIPPFDLMLIFTNEYGFSSIIRIYGVEITDEGGTYSINDIYSENVMQFIAKDIDPMISSSMMGDGDGGVTVDADGNVIDTKGKYKSLLFTKMMQGKVIDEHYASMIKYVEKLEKELADLEKKIENDRLTANSYNPKITSKSDVSDRRKERNKEREVVKKTLELNVKRRDVLFKEIEQMYYTIRKYEQTKMTWDLNSSIQPNYTSTFAFNDKNIK